MLTQQKTPNDIIDENIVDTKNFIYLLKIYMKLTQLIFKKMEWFIENSHFFTTHDFDLVKEEATKHLKKNLLHQNTYVLENINLSLKNSKNYKIHELNQLRKTLLNSLKNYKKIKKENNIWLQHLNVISQPNPLSTRLMISLKHEKESAKIYEEILTQNGRRDGILTLLHVQATLSPFQPWIDAKPMSVRLEEALNIAGMNKCKNKDMRIGKREVLNDIQHILYQHAEKKQKAYLIPMSSTTSREKVTTLWKEIERRKKDFDYMYEEIKKNPDDATLPHFRKELFHNENLLRKLSIAVGQFAFLKPKEVKPYKYLEKSISYFAEKEPYDEKLDSNRNCNSSDITKPE